MKLRRSIDCLRLVWRFMGAVKIASNFQQFPEYESSGGYFHFDLGDLAMIWNNIELN